MKPILITDGTFKHAKAAARSLRAKGIPVRLHGCRWDRHTCMLGNDIGGIIPVSYDAVMTLNAFRDVVDAPFLLPDTHSIRVAGDKGSTVRLAQEIGITVPRTYTGYQLGKFLEEPEFYPFVVKSAIGSGSIRYANTKAEGEKAVREVAMPIIQKYVPGQGYGYFALYLHGKPVAEFMHRRLREFPATGGPSTWAESVYDENLKAAGRTILDALDWHGPAMVEFKKTPGGRFVLMEVNPKLWGSLELGIRAGVDFPYLMYLAMTGQEIPEQGQYRVGFQMRWFWWDLMARVTKDWYFPHGRLNV